MKKLVSLISILAVILLVLPLVADKAVELTSASCSPFGVGVEMKCTYKGNGCTVNEEASNSGQCDGNRCATFMDEEGCTQRWCHRLTAHATDDCKRVRDALSIVRHCPKAPPEEIDDDPPA